MHQKYFRLLLAWLAAAPLATLAQTGNVGIGTTAPTQKLDVDGQVRVRGLSGPDTRLPVVLPDGTLGVSAPFGTAANTATPIPAAATGTAGTDGSLPYGVAVSGTTAYVVSFLGNSLQVFDVRNPASPVLLGRATTADGPRKIVVSGTTAYVAFYGNSGNSGLQTFDVRNPASPVALVSANQFFTVDVALSSTRVCAVGRDELYAYAVSPTGGAPQYLGSVLLNVGNSTYNTTFGLASSVAVSGTTALVTLENNSIRTFDVSTGTPVRTGDVPTAAGPKSIVVSGATAYVACGSALQTFSLANPSSPLLLSTVPTGGNSVSVAVSGTRAYVASGTNLEVFDVANPASPVLLGTVPLSGTLLDVAANGNTAYVTSQNNTLQVVAASTTPPDRVVTVGPTGGLASVALPGAADFVQNQTAKSQLGGFSVSGTGTVGGLLTAGSAAVGGLLTAGSATVGGLLTTGSLNSRGTGTVGGLLTAGSATVSGNVGIGTSTPGARLSISPGTLEPKLTLWDSGSSTNHYGFGISSSQLNYHVLTTTDSHVFWAGGKNGDGFELLRIQGNGNVGIGTSPGPSFKLDVNGNANFSGVVFANGQVVTSDRRFKQHVRPLTSALAGVLALRGVRYEWNALGVQRGGTAGAPQVGLIAQELEKVYPELVSTDAAGYKAVNYAQLAPVLIEALKEQQAQIEALKAEAAAAKTAAGTANAAAAAANTRAASAETKAAQATATLETFEARLRRLEAGGGQAQR